MGAGVRAKLAKLSHVTGLMPVLGRLRMAQQDELRILAYHRILDSSDPPGFNFDVERISATRRDFRKQMQWVKRHFHPMRFEEVLSYMDAGRRLPPRAVLVTFDDGYDDNYHVAYPILRELDMSAMFFVSTGYIDSGLPYAYDWLVFMICTTAAPMLRAPELERDWPLTDSLGQRRTVANEVLSRLKSLQAVDQLALIGRLEEEWGMPRASGHDDCRPMTWDQLREMRRGGMEIGSHGVNHCMLAKLPLQDMHYEVAASKQALERELEEPVHVISYPVGGDDAFDDQVIDAVRQAGYRLGCSYVSQVAQLRPDNAYALPRLHVERDMDPVRVEAVITWPEVFGFSTPQKKR